MNIERTKGHATFSHYEIHDGTKSVLAMVTRSCSVSNGPERERVIVTIRGTMSERARERYARGVESQHRAEWSRFAFVFGPHGALDARSYDRWNA